MLPRPVVLPVSQVMRFMEALVYDLAAEEFNRSTPGLGLLGFSLEGPRRAKHQAA